MAEFLLGAGAGTGPLEVDLHGPDVLLDGRDLRTGHALGPHTIKKKIRHFLQ